MFNLTITFAGLCLLVPDRANAMLHVLMPSTPGHEPHIPALVFVDQEGNVQCPEISGMHLELPQLLSSGFDSAVGAEVFDFGGALLGERKVPRALLGDGAPAEPVRARMRLKAGRYSRARRGGGFWKFKGHNGPDSRRLPTAVDWVIRNVNFPHLEIKNTAGSDTFKVFPVNNAIHVLVVNVTQAELDVMGPDVPPHANCPPADHPASHFLVYRELLTPSDAFDPPEFDQVQSQGQGICPPVNSGGRPSEQAQGTARSADGHPVSDSQSPAHPIHGTLTTAGAGSELTCMVATAPPG